jgi:hypothetical protein
VRTICGWNLPGGFSCDDDDADGNARRAAPTTMLKKLADITHFSAM